MNYMEVTGKRRQYKRHFRQISCMCKGPVVGSSWYVENQEEASMVGVMEKWSKTKLEL